MSTLSDAPTGVEMMNPEGSGSVIPSDDHRGQLCYTFKQEDMWLRFADLALDLFSKAKAGHVI